MRALDLFSGIGGISLAAEWAGIETVAFCEIEPYCQKVLRRHWPDVPIYEDVRTITKEQLERDGVMEDGTIDLICGGYPCQPFSAAGKRRGSEDDRHLWPEMFRLVRELRPTWVVGENVAGHVTLGLDDVLADLEGEGYKVRAFLIPACGVGAPHKRERVFIVAHTSSGQREPRAKEPGTLRTVYESMGYSDSCGVERKGSKQQTTGIGGTGESMADAIHPGVEGWTATGNPESQRAECYQHPQRCDQLQRGEGRATQPGLGGAFDGIPAWMDEYRWPAAFGQPQHEWEPPRIGQGIPNRRERLKALGNAVVPLQIYPIMEAIMRIERGEG